MLNNLQASNEDKQIIATELGEYYNNPLEDKYSMGDQVKAYKNQFKGK